MWEVPVAQSTGTPLYIYIDWRCLFAWETGPMAAELVDLLSTNYALTLLIANFRVTPHKVIAALLSPPCLPLIVLGNLEVRALLQTAPIPVRPAKWQNVERTNKSRTR